MGRNPHCPLFLVACALRRLRTTPRKSKVKAAVKIGSGGGNSARPRGDQVAAFFVWALQSYPRHKVGKERRPNTAPLADSTSARVIVLTFLPRCSLSNSPASPKERTDGTESTDGSSTSPRLGQADTGEIQTPNCCYAYCIAQ